MKKLSSLNFNSLGTFLQGLGAIGVAYAAIFSIPGIFETSSEQWFYIGEWDTNSNQFVNRYIEEMKKPVPGEKVSITGRVDIRTKPYNNKKSLDIGTIRGSEESPIKKELFAVQERKLGENKTAIWGRIMD